MWCFGCHKASSNVIIYTLRFREFQFFFYVFFFELVVGVVEIAFNYLWGQTGIGVTKQRSWCENRFHEGKELVEILNW